jgi:hypothetical protein
MILNLLDVILLYFNNCRKEMCNKFHSVPVGYKFKKFVYKLQGKSIKDLSDYEVSKAFESI